MAYNPTLMMALASERTNDLKYRAQTQSLRFAWPFRRSSPAPSSVRNAPLTRQKAY